MDNQMRREKLYEMLENAEKPLTGVVLSKALNVTRQIIVSDVALLRSSGKKIISTARGYQLAGEAQEKGFHQEIHCQSRAMDDGELEAELNVVVDNGGIVHGLVLSHEVYGVIQVPMKLYSRRDVRQYMDRLREEKGPLIVTLTQGRHTLLVETRNDEDMDALEEGLKELGVLE
ncbi:3H domain-containing protein [Acidaminococcus fermentans]|uniref:3H domain-containing protein n=1 Tax=Acidaminococcus fermentans TaxID=905 RepID=UPI003F8B370F